MRTRHLLGILLALVAVIATTGPTNAAATTERRVEIPPEGVLSAMTGGNTVGAIIREKKARVDGYLHLDTPAMIKTLKAMHANTFTYGVWDGDKDWDDLRLEFAPAAQKAGIDIWVYLVPPSECFTNPAKHLNGNCSRPYDLDFITWSTEIAKLSKKYPNIKAWAIDDFLSGPGNRALFTNEYLSQVRAAQDAINPKLGFYVTLYFGEIAPENLEIIDGVLDGVIYPYVGYNADTNDTDWVERRIDSALQTMEPYDLDLVFLQYTGRFLDTVIEPHEDTVAAILRRVQPYIEDGRVIGVIAYAAPVALDEQQASYTNRAHSGTGRLSFSINMFTGTSAGDHAEAKQEVRVDPRAAKKELTFSHRDPFGPWALKDYQFKQLLVDGQVVWESDISADAGYTWAKTTVDLTAALAGKQKATIAFRLFHKNGVGHWPTDVSIDDVRARGLTLRNGDFENASAWELSETNEGFRTFIDQYRPDRQARIINEIGKVYADLRGQRHRTVEAPAWARAQWKKLHTGGDNVAFNGNGRLSFSQPEGTTSPEGETCASAWQDVRVQPGLPRYEISFWHGDTWSFGGEHIQHKQLVIDGEVLWKRSTRDAWDWYQIYGSDHQGAIDVTDFVKGKKQVRLEFRMCNDKAYGELFMDATFDAIRTAGLDVRNPDFETTSAWHLTSSAPLRARIAISR